MILGAYTLHLYCKNECKTKYGNLRLGQFVADNEREARKQAKERGWKFVRKDVICPECNQQKKD